MGIMMDAAPATKRQSPGPSYVDVERAQVPDSGYVTQSTSLNSKAPEPFPPESPAVESEARPEPFPPKSPAVEDKPRPEPFRLSRLFRLTDLADLVDLAEFDKPVDDHTVSRFRLVYTQIEKPLLDYIRRKASGRTYRPIALRLMVLGRNEDDAKPCIVASCPEEQCKRVRKFFHKSHVAALCRPEDDAVPSFDVFVRGRSLETKHRDEDADILIPIVGGHEGYTIETYCGAPILIRGDSSEVRACTFGGIISAVSMDGIRKLYGLTVGHVLLGDSDNDIPSDDWDLQFSDSESEDEPDEVVEPDPEKTEFLPAMNNSHLTSDDSHHPFASWESSKLRKIGCIAKDSLAQIATPNIIREDAGGYYDWALIDMKKYKPNLIRPRKLRNGKIQGEDIKSGDLLTPVTPPCSSGKRQSVTLLSGSGGLKCGSLSPLPSRLLLGPGNAFVDTLILNLDNDQQIQDGDSGSWVVNEATFEVYGYVVAADCFGGGYVIPILEAFRSIGASLGPSYSVHVATTVDMVVAKLDDNRCAASGQVTPFEEDGEDYQCPIPRILSNPIPISKSLGGVRQPDSGYNSLEK